jgi:mannosyltransferase
LVLSTRSVQPLAIPVIAFAFAVRLLGLERLPLWWDEGTSLFAARLSLAELSVTKDFALDLHPPVYYVMLGAWCQVAGCGVFSARLFSVLVGVLAVALTAAVARQVFGTRAAVVAAAFVAATPMQVHYSQEIRMYSMVTAIGALTMFVAMKHLGSLTGDHLSRRPSTRLWVGLSLLIGSLAYVYYFLAALAIPLAVVGSALVVRQPRLLARWLTPFAIGFALWLPWVAFLWSAAIASGASGIPTGDQTHLTLWRLVEQTWLAMTLGFVRPAQLVIPIAVGAAILMIVGLVVPGSGKKRLGWVMLVTIVGAITLMYLVALARPFYYPRMLIFIVPSVAALVATGLTRLVPRGSWGTAIASLAVIAITLPALQGHYRTERTGYSPADFLVVLNGLRAHVRDGDLLVAGHSWQIGYVIGYLPDLTLTMIMDRAIGSPGEPDATPDQRTWVLSNSPDSTWTGLRVEDKYGQAMPTRYVDQFGDTRLRLFGPANGEATPGRVATFGEVAALEDTRLTLAEPMKPGAQLDLVLWWRALSRINAGYTVFTQALGPDGKVWAQLDGPPLDGQRQTNIWDPGELVVDRRQLRLDAQAPAGAYLLQVGLYNSQSGERLAANKSSDEIDRVIVGRFSVER